MTKKDFIVDLDISIKERDAMRVCASIARYTVDKRGCDDWSVYEAVQFYNKHIDINVHIGLDVYTMVVAAISKKA